MICLAQYYLFLHQDISNIEHYTYVYNTITYVFVSCVDRSTSELQEKIRKKVSEKNVRLTSYRLKFKL